MKKLQLSHLTRFHVEKTEMSEWVLEAYSCTAEEAERHTLDHHSKH